MKNLFKLFTLIALFLVAGLANRANAQSYCAPYFASGCNSDYISTFQFSNFNNSALGCNTSGYDTSFLARGAINVFRGKTYNLRMLCPAAEGIAAFIDYNGNGSFEDTAENVAGDFNGTIDSVNGGVTIPLTVTPKKTRMRVLCASGGTNTVGPNGDCGSYAAGGEALDFIINILAPAKDVGISVINTPQNLGCPSANEQVKVTLTNYGSASQTNFPVVLVYGSATTTTTYKRTLKPTQSDTFTVGYFNASTFATYKFKVYTNLTNDSDRTNDTLSVAVAIKQPSAPTVGNIKHCGPASGFYLPGASTAPNATTFWFKNATTDTVIAKGDSLAIPYLATGTVTYYAESRLPNTAAITKGNWSTTSRANYGNMFDVVPKTNIVIDSFDVNDGTPGSTDAITVYYRLGTYFGAQANPSDWIKVATVTVNTKGDGSPSRLALPKGSAISLQVGNTYGFYIEPTSTQLYYDITGSKNVTVSNSDMTINAGCSTAGAFSGISPGRDWFGNIYYNYYACNSQRLASSVTILQGVNGATFFKSTPFDGQYNTGDIYDPDNMCVGDTNTYQLSSPKGFSNGDYGTKWSITNLSFGTGAGTKSTDTFFRVPTPSKNGVFSFFPKKYGDSIFILKFHLHNIATGCDSAILRYIHIRNLPVAKFGFTNACQGFPVVFVDSSTNKPSTVSSWAWKFGDASTSTTQSPSHTYAKAGTDNVTLTATTAEGCSSSMTRTVTTYKVPNVGFTDVLGCNGLPTVFNDTTSNIPVSSISTWKWFFGDKTSGFVQAPTHTYLKSGPYTVKEVVTTVNGCKDSMTTKIRVQATPVPVFSFTPVCVGDSMGFQNISVDSSHAGTYKWNFGNGKTSTKLLPYVTYAANGTYKITLTVTTKFGCVDSLTQSITPYAKPTPRYFASNACTGQSVTLSDSSNPGKFSTFNWNYGDGKTSPTGNVSSSIKHTYTKAGTYLTSLQILNSNGCTDTESRSVTIIDFPKASFTANTVCEGNPTIFTNTSSGTGALTYFWVFDDGTSNSTNQNPTHTYPIADTFNVKLSAINKYNCVNSTSSVITVNATPFIAPWILKKHGYQVSFTPADTTIGNFVWHFGTPTGDSSSKKLASFTYPASPASYTVTLVVTNGSGCVTVRTDTLSVAASGIQPNANTFSGVSVYPNPFEGSTNINYKLTTQSKVTIGIYDVQGREVARLKDGDYPAGDYSDAFDAKKYSTSDGVYFLKMYVNDQYFTTKIVNLK